MQQANGVTQQMEMEVSRPIVACSLGVSLGASMCLYLSCVGYLSLGLVLVFSSTGAEDM